MKLIGNILWVILGGLVWSIALFLNGLLCCVTIVGIPVGIQLFKMAGFVLWPFGKQVSDVKAKGLKFVLNVIWAVLFGWEYALGFLITGLLFCITIIGIPFGKQYFKLASFIILPLGREFK